MVERGIGCGEVQEITVLTKAKEHRGGTEASRLILGVEVVRYDWTTGGTVAHTDPLRVFLPRWTTAAVETTPTSQNLRLTASLGMLNTENPNGPKTMLEASHELSMGGVAIDSGGLDVVNWVAVLPTAGRSTRVMLDDVIHFGNVAFEAIGIANQNNVLVRTSDR